MRIPCRCTERFAVPTSAIRFWLDFCSCFAVCPRFSGTRRIHKLGTTFESLQKSGFILLVDNAPEELVLGLVGKFWTLSGSIQKMSAGEFTAFNSPGYTKAVWNFCLRRLPDGRTLLSMKTRVTCTDDVSRKKFRRYWFFVRPFSGLIRKEALRIIQHNAEQQPSLVAENFP